MSVLRIQAIRFTKGGCEGKTLLLETAAEERVRFLSCLLIFADQHIDVIFCLILLPVRFLQCFQQQIRGFCVSDVKQDTFF